MFPKTNVDSSKDIASTLFEIKNLLTEIISVDSSSSDESLVKLKNKFNSLKEITKILSRKHAELLLACSDIQLLLKSTHVIRAFYEYYDEILSAKALLANEDYEKLIKNYSLINFPETAIHHEKFKRLSENKKHCLVVGCGAIPSTVMLLGENTDLRLSAIDRCATSIDLASSILSFWQRSPVSLKAIDVLSLTDFSDWDCIFLNALVGGDEGMGGASKKEVVNHMLKYCEKETLLCFRTPHLVGQWIYPKIDVSILKDYNVTHIPPPVADRSGLTIVQL